MPDPHTPAMSVGSPALHVNPALLTVGVGTLLDLISHQQGKRSVQKHLLANGFFLFLMDCLKGLVMVEQNCLVRVGCVCGTRQGCWASSCPGQAQGDGTRVSQVTPCSQENRNSGGAGPGHKRKPSPAQVPQSWVFMDMDEVLSRDIREESRALKGHPQKDREVVPSSLFHRPSRAWQVTRASRVRPRDP